MSTDEKPFGDREFIKLQAAILNDEVSVEELKSFFRAYQEQQFAPAEQSVRKAIRGMGVAVGPDMDGWTDEARDHFTEIFYDIVRNGPEETSHIAMLTRAMAIYRSFLVHVRAGGEVVYRGVGKEKKLVVRPRKP